MAADEAEIQPMADEAEIKPMAKTEIKTFEFDLERAKKTIKRVLGDVIDDNKISIAIDHFMKNHDDIKTADDVLYYFQYSTRDERKFIGIDETEKEKIISRIKTYIISEERKADTKADDAYEESQNASSVDGGARIRRARKSAVKRRKSSRRSSKQRKSSRRQLPLRRRRTNKK